MSRLQEGRDERHPQTYGDPAPTSSATAAWQDRTKIPSSRGYERCAATLSTPPSPRTMAGLSSARAHGVDDATDLNAAVVLENGEAPASVVVV
jgi:hypothetical protein